jgi:membrane protein
MTMKIKGMTGILKSTFAEFGEDNVMRLSAALAYYAIFSIGPLLAIVVGVAGLALGHESVRHQIEQQLQRMLGEGASKVVDSMMSARQHGTSLITTIVGVIALLFGASGVFGQLQDSLNTIWEVKTKPGQGIWTLVRYRFLSFSMVLGVGFLLLVSLALSTAVGALTGYLNEKIPLGGVIAHVVDLVVSFGVVTVLFAMIFKYLPDVRVPWKKVWIGAIGTAFLFTIGKYLLGLYLGRQSTSSAYGAAGSVIVILMWIYYASVILFFGAEFTQVYAKQTGAKIRTTKYAAPVTEEQRAEEGIPRKEAIGSGPVPAHARARTEAEKPNGQKPAATRAAARHPEQGRSPGGTLRQHVVEIVWLTFVTGLVSGALFKIRPLRKAAKLYIKFGMPGLK